MTTEEKINYLMSIDEDAELVQQELTRIVEMSYDKDGFIRSQVAVALVYFDNKLAQETLLRLACDEDSLVRTEAYDSLAVYVNADVLVFLENAIKIEKDEIACSYAIMSWTDILLGLQEEVAKKSKILLEIKNMDTIKESEHCRLSCYRAQYLFGENTAFDEIVECLNSSDYHIRYSAICVLEEIAREENSGDIERALNHLLAMEKSKAVSEKGKAVLNQLSISLG